MKIRPMALIVAVACTALGGCGGGTSSTSNNAPKNYTIGGTVSGLLGGETLQLSNNGADTVSVTANGSFTFPTALAAGATYAITVSQQPTASTCTVSQGRGTASAPVSNVMVACAPSLVKRIALFADIKTGDLMNYLYDPSTGALSPLALPEAIAGPGPTAITIDSSDSRAFTLGQNNAGVATLSGFNIGAGGLISPDNQQPLATNGLSFALDMAGDTIYVLQQSAGAGAATTLTAFPIDPTSGAIGAAGAPLAMPSATATIMARNPAGDFVYVLDTGSNQIYAVNIGSNATTGNPMAVASISNTGAGPVALAVTPNGQYLYVLNNTANTVSMFTPPTGAATLGTATSIAITAPSGGVAQNLTQILVDPSGQYLYIYDLANKLIDQYSINQTNGQLTPLAPATIAMPAPTGSAVTLAIAGTAAAGLLYDASGTSLYSWTIDPATGQLTPSSPPNVTLGSSTGIGPMAFGQ